MAHTTGSTSAGKRSMLIARAPRMISAHCQSKCSDVEKPPSIPSLVLPLFLCIHSPSIRPHDGPMSRFQKIGTISRGGLLQSRSTPRGEKRTLPPLASFVSASSQELVTRMSFERDGGHDEPSRGSLTALIMEGAG